MIQFLFGKGKLGMKSVEVGKSYLTTFCFKELVVTVIKIIPNSGEHGNGRWNISCIVRDENGYEFLRRISDLKLKENTDELK